MKYLIKFREAVDWDNDAILMDTEYITVENGVMIFSNDPTFLVNELYVPINSISFCRNVDGIEMVADDDIPSFPSGYLN